MTQFSHDDRRKFIGWLARIFMLAPLVAGASTKLKPTPAVTVGPFYPPQPMGLPFFGAKALSGASVSDPAVHPAFCGPGEQLANWVVAGQPVRASHPRPGAELAPVIGPWRVDQA